MYPVIPSGFLPANWSNNTSDNGICDDLLLYTPMYIIPPVSVVGIFLNILAIVVFFKTKTTTIKGDEHKLLLNARMTFLKGELCHFFYYCRTVRPCLITVVTTAIVSIWTTCQIYEILNYK